MIAPELHRMPTPDLETLGRTIWRLARHHRRNGNRPGETRNRELLDTINTELQARFTDKATQ